MPTFICQSRFSISREVLFSFHESELGFNTLVTNDTNVELIQKPKTLEIGEMAIIRVKIFPGFKPVWKSKHTGYQKNEFFEDTQIEGPFLKFIHKHKFLSNSDPNFPSILSDEIEYEFYPIPFSNWVILQMLSRMFLKRHDLTGKTLFAKQELIFCGYARTIVD
ncbi:hypothetical protein P3G55_02855 [Leptospira sp. 96542]|nr:hypothetical protein [Leptospira sp. 96542]